MNKESIVGLLSNSPCNSEFLINPYKKQAKCRSIEKPWDSHGEWLEERNFKRGYKLKKKNRPIERQMKILNHLLKKENLENLTRIVNIKCEENIGK